MNKILVLISEDLLQIDPKGLSDEAELKDLICDIGFTETSDSITSLSPEYTDHPYQLGIFNDDNDQYWVAEFKKTTKLIDLNLIGSLDNLKEKIETNGLDEVINSTPYITLKKSMLEHQSDLKHDSNGTYQSLYAQANHLIEELHAQNMGNADSMIQSIADICRQFWQADLKVSNFDFQTYKKMFPENYELDSKTRHLLIEDNKIAWVGEFEEIKQHWDTALSYPEFRSNCKEIAAWALNANF